MVRLLQNGSRLRIFCTIHVSIPQWCDCCKREADDLLQTEIVSIPQWCDCCPRFCLQTSATAVSIPQWCDCCSELRLVAVSPAGRFNPTMVRLLHEIQLERACGTNSFQSHNGAIAAIPNCAARVSQNGFNPTMVRLLHCPTATSHKPARFVSIPQWCDCCRHSSAMRCRSSGVFQSHNGAIAAVLSVPTMSLPERFQSHNGAIAATQSRAYLTELAEVSIPQWCDCCLPTWKLRPTEPSEFQSHNGAIAARR